MTAENDTIVAAATPPGIGGVGIVRISGPAATTIATRMLDSLPKARRASYRRFRDAEGEAIDAGLALYFLIRYVHRALARKPAEANP